MQTHCQFDTSEQIPIKIWIKKKSYDKNAFQNGVGNCK